MLQLSYEHRQGQYRMGRKHLHLITAALLAFVFLVNCRVRQVQAGETSKLAEKGSYLLLVTFYNSSGVERLATLDQSPYDGVAVPLVDAYDTGVPPRFQQVQARFAALHRQTYKHLWPWVFVNRMVGAGGSNPQANKPGFQKIKGLDLDGTDGAKRAFLDLWRSALRQAKTTKVPGVVLDMEFYNNYAAYSIANLVWERHLPAAKVKKQLRQIGDRMARTAGEEYPYARIWVLNTGLSSPNGLISTKANQSTRNYILRGLLDGARRRQLGLVVVDGGEESLGYCHHSASALRDAIQSRLKQYTPLLRDYQGTLQLGGTIALWRDAESRYGWLREGNCAVTDVQRPEDFSPYLNLLFANYRFVWIYAPIVGRYDPFDPVSSRRIDEVLSHAR